MCCFRTYVLLLLTEASLWGFTLAEFQLIDGHDPESLRMEISVSWFLFKGCKKCSGDLASDDGDWICLQCGTYYYVGLYQAGRESLNLARPSPEMAELMEQVPPTDKGKILTPNLFPILHGFLAGVN